MKMALGSKAEHGFGLLSLEPHFNTICACSLMSFCLILTQCLFGLNYYEFVSPIFI